MAKGHTKPDAFYDVSVLPHPKENILLAIEREILREPSDARVEWLAVGATFLPSFQEGIGLKPLSWLGVDLAELQHSTSDLKEQAKILAQNPDRERAERFLTVMKIESDQIQARIDAALRLRKARMNHSTLETADTGAEARSKINSPRTSGIASQNCAGEANPIDRYRKAAERGDAEAQFYIAEAYYEGDGVPHDCSLAAKWWLKAAEQGCAAAQYQLGCAYSNGEGVPRDHVQAYMWFTLEWKSNSNVGPRIFYNPASDQQKRELRKLMTAAQVATARQLAKEWRPKTPSSNPS